MHVCTIKYTYIQGFIIVTLVIYVFSSVISEACNIECQVYREAEGHMRRGDNKNNNIKKNLVYFIFTIFFII